MSLKIPRHSQWIWNSLLLMFSFWTLGVGISGLLIWWRDERWRERSRHNNTSILFSPVIDRIIHVRSPPQLNSWLIKTCGGGRWMSESCLNLNISRLQWKFHHEETGPEAGPWQKIQVPISRRNDNWINKQDAVKVISTVEMTTFCSF